MNFFKTKLPSKIVSMAVCENKLFVATEETLYELKEFYGDKILSPVLISGDETRTFTATFSGARHD